MPYMAPLSLISGLIWGAPLAPYSWVIPWLFAVMTFSAGLSLDPQELKKLVTHPFFLLVNIFILHLVIPVGTWLLSSAIYSNSEIITGLVIISLTPIGSTSIVWVSIYKGNVSLALAVIVLDTLLVPIFPPFMLELLVGTGIEMDSLSIMTSLFWMILFPSLLAMLLNKISHGRARQILSPRLSVLSKIGIIALLAINGGVASPYFHNPTWQLLGILIFIFCLCCSGYIINYWAGKVLFKRKQDIMAFMLCGGIRNVGAGAAIAILYFPPLTCLTVVVGMMFQQILGYNAGLIADKRLHEPIPVSH